MLLLLACTLTPEKLADRQDNEQSDSFSAGCAETAAPFTGALTLTTAEGERGYTLVVTESYDPQVPHRLIFGFAGTNWIGEQIIRL